MQILISNRELQNIQVRREIINKNSKLIVLINEQINKQKYLYKYRYFN